MRDVEDAAQSNPDAIWPGQIADALRGLIHQANLARDHGLAAVPDQAAAPIRAFRHGVQVGLAVIRRPPGPEHEDVTFRAGLRNRFTVRTSGYPAVRMTEEGALPRGVRFIAGHNGTATIAGTPAASARGRTFIIRVTASNGVGKSAVQRFTLTVR